MKSALMMALVTLCVLIAGGIGACIAGCGAVDVAKYKKDTMECREQSKTCEAYVACRSAVEADAGRKWVASCKDGGADAQ